MFTIVIVRRVNTERAILLVRCPVVVPIVRLAHLKVVMSQFVKIFAYGGFLFNLAMRLVGSDKLSCCAICDKKLILMKIVIVVKDDSYMIVKTNLFCMDGLPHPHSSY